MTTAATNGRIAAAFVCAAVPALAMVMMACGTGELETTTPVTTAPAPVHTVIGNYGFALRPLGVSQPVEITVTGAGIGTLDATAQWTLASNDVDLFVTDHDCTVSSLDALEECNILARADSVTNKPEIIKQSLGVGVYRLYVHNCGQEAESGTLVIGFTR